MPAEPGPESPPTGPYPTLLCNSSPPTPSSQDSPWLGKRTEPAWAFQDFQHQLGHGWNPTALRDPGISGQQQGARVSGASRELLQGGRVSPVGPRLGCVWARRWSWTDSAKACRCSLQDSWPAGLMGARSCGATWVSRDSATNSSGGLAPTSVCF